MDTLRLASAGRIAALLAAAALATAEPALAHHAMGNTLPSTLMQGVLSGLGHPVIGLDHLAALIAVGCLAALHPAGGRLVVGYVAAMVAGAALHVQGLTVPASEALVALSVVALGAVLIWGRSLATLAALGLFAVVGLLHGYALGESIVGAEPTPLIAYFAGLAVVQTAIGLGALLLARMVAERPAALITPARVVGVVAVAVGMASLVV